MEEYKNLFEYQNFFQRFAHVKSHLLCGEENDIIPFVTIIIPTYKRPALLKDAIDSAVNQKGFDDYEVVIVDNDPEQSFKTETQLLVESYQNSKIRYYKHDENIGMFANWNRGVELAKSKWVTLLHDDDVYFSYYLNAMCSILSNKPHIEGLKGRQYYWQDDKKRNILDVENDFSFTKGNVRRVKKIDNFFVNSINPTGLFYKKSRIIELGGFSIDWYPSSDYLFGTNYLFHFNTYTTFEYLGIYRWAENESLRYETKAKMIEQDFYLRNNYIRLLRFKNPIWRELNIYLTQTAIKRTLLTQDNRLDSKLQEIYNKKNICLFCTKLFYRLYRVNVTIRDRTFYTRLLKKFI